MATERKVYSAEFKREAIRQVEKGRKRREVELSLGITEGLLWKWEESFRKKEDKADAFPGHGNLSASDARIRELERENARLKEDKEILKKVLQLYSKEGV
jgi:transposase